MKTSNNLFFSLFIAGLLLFSVTGCKKTIQVDPAPKGSMDDLRVPATFNWQTTREVQFTLGADLEGMNSGMLARISVFDGHPGTGGTLLATGSAGFEYPFITLLRLPTALQEVWLMAQTATGYLQVESVQVTENISYLFTGNGEMKFSPDAVMDPDCSTGCTEYVSGSNAITINQGKTFCVTDAFTGQVNFQPWAGGGTLKVCGVATPAGISNFGNNCSIIVTGGGSFSAGLTLSMDGGSSIHVYTGSSFQVTGINMNNAASTVTNYSDGFSVTQSIGSNGTILNYGTLTIGTNYTLWSSGFLENYGSLTIGGKFEVNNDITNSGSIESGLNMDFNSGSVVINTCKLVSHANVNLNSTNFTMNNGYLKADQQTNVYGSSALILQNQSMISTNTYQQNTNISGQGSGNTIKIHSSGAINSSRTVSGPVEMSTPSGTLTNGNISLFINGATLVSTANATNYIPVTPCNPEGSGVQPVTDTDGDGVPDNLDDYPLDPTRAYNTWYPSSSTFGSVGFEDLWPSKGDYDMNDLVVDYQYKVVSNAQNNIVDIIPKYYVRAVGATLRNGFGFQLNNIDPAQVASVTGYSLLYGYITLNANGTEANQANAVIIVFDNVDNVINRPSTGSFYNTTPGSPKGISDTVYIDIHFSVPAPPLTLGTPPYNIFLIKDMNRGIEIHMPDNIPTSLADPAYFGANDDTSDPATGRYYKTGNNLPWAINTPVLFDYTYEIIPIIQGYNHFATWAESGGISYPDWYTDQPGYRVESNIYE